MPLPEQAIQNIHKIREALENIDQKSFPYPTSFNLEKFPKGCCGDTIDLIGYYLLKHYNIDSYFITKKGWKKDPEVNRSEEHTSELQSRPHLVCRLLLEKKKT